MNERIARVLQNMQRMQLSQILVSAPASIAYLTGLRVGPGERLCALLIDDDGHVTLHANRLFALESGADFALVEHDDTDDCIAVLQRDVKPGGILGIDKTWPGGFAVRLMDCRGDVKLALGSAPVDEARMCKTEAEICLMRASSLANDRATKKALEGMTIGETEKDAAARYTACALAEGASGCSFAPLVCFGAGAAEPHHDTADVVLQDGDAVIMDVGLKLAGYCSGMTRTAFMGSMTDEQKRVYDIVRAANEAGRAAAKPGVPLCDIDKAARDVITAAGYGEFFLHRTGHGIGLEVHEPPDVSATSRIIAQPGMVFSVEPGIYLKGKFGVRVEDLVAITEDGAITLNELGREPLVL